MDDLTSANPDIPTRGEFLARVGAFRRRERRDAMYRVATFLVERWWGTPRDLADALGVLLLTWNQAFYRYGAFRFDALERCIAENLTSLDAFRRQELAMLSPNDEREIRRLFAAFLRALKIPPNRRGTRRSPVAVAKALHLLAPRFFPLWDEAIAKAYGCFYAAKPAEQYVAFCRKIKVLAETVGNYVTDPDRPLLKLIDEYNYAKFTKGWR